MSNKFNQDELRSKYEPRQLSGQQEFDDLMTEVNNDMEQLLAPIREQQRKNRDKRDFLRLQIANLKCQMQLLNMEFSRMEDDRKDIRTFFWQLKHDIIRLNPRKGGYGPKHEEGGRA